MTVVIGGEIPPGALPHVQAPVRAVAGGVTVGELNRNINALREDLRSTRAELQGIHALRTKVEVSGTKLDELDGRVDELEAGVRWLVRLVMGLIVTALLGLVIASGAV